MESIWDLIAQWKNGRKGHLRTHFFFPPIERTQFKGTYASSIS